MSPDQPNHPSPVIYARLAIALAIVLLMLLPGELWQAPANDFEADGFDGATQHSRHKSAYVFDPFVVVENGTWQPCPCQPASYLAIVGQDLTTATARDREGALELAGTSVMVDGKPTKVYLVSPSQVNFFLPGLAGPTATVTLVSGGKEKGRQVVGVQPADAEERGLVDISPQRLLLASSLGAEPAVHLLTSPLSFQVAFDVTILGQEGLGRPFQAMVWNSRNFSSVAVVFQPSPARDVAVELVENRGKLARRLALGTYRLGEPYRIEIELERSKQLTMTVSALRWGGQVGTEDVLAPHPLGRVTLSKADAPALLPPTDRPSLLSAAGRTAPTPPSSPTITWSYRTRGSPPFG